MKGIDHALKALTDLCRKQHGAMERPVMDGKAACRARFRLLDMYPMSRASDGLVPDVSEAGGNAASDRLGDKGIDRTAYQHDRAVKPALVCTRRMPLVPGIDERRDDRRPYYLAKAAQHVLFCLRKSMREMLAGLALRVRLATEALERLHAFGGRIQITIRKTCCSRHQQTTLRDQLELTLDTT